MDAYTLSRIFKQFKPKNQQTPPTQPIEPHNIIVYAGDYHARVYGEFLRENGYRLVQRTGYFHDEKSGEESIDYDLSCIDISNFKQPFFS